MDTNVLSCSKCGHTVSESAEVCAYCGTAVSSDDAPSAPDVESSGVPAQAAEPSPIPQDDSAGKTEIPDVAADAEPSSQRDPEEKQMDIVEPAAEAVSGIDNQPSDVDDDIDFQFSDDELLVELDTEEAAKIPEEAGGEEPEITAASEPAAIPDLTSGLDDIVDLEQQAAEATAEVIPLADKVSAETAPDDSPDLPKTPVLEVSGEDTSESETLGADILELVQVEATEQESAEAQISETLKPVDEPAIEQTTESAPDETPEGSKNNDDDLNSILMAPADEDQPLKQPLSGGVEDAVETGASEKPAAKSDDSSDVIQKQADGQASGEAIETEIANQDLAEARKKKMAAQARAKALKVHKLKLAKAQALKKEKLKLAKAQALKKQKAAQAGIEKANTEVAAGFHAPEADPPPCKHPKAGRKHKNAGSA
ncbi:MAG: zinc ribbon domain-containing protein [Deltaproteobacteria bacterium]|nr:zinc ribbon domain-containing protein [Deltaproteobacteria bacterium]